MMRELLGWLLTLYMLIMVLKAINYVAHWLEQEEELQHTLLASSVI